MKLRSGLVFASSLVLVLGGCAAGTGGEQAPQPQPQLEGEELAPGEQPRRTAQTDLAAEALEEGQEAQEEGNTQEARPHFEQALSAANQAIINDSTNPLPWYQGGLAHLGLRDFQQADSMLARAEELRPVYELETIGVRERAWVELYQEAIPLVQEQKYEEAVPVFESANAIYRGRPEAMVTLGQIYLQTGEYEAAVENFRDALDIIQSERVEEMDSATVAAWQEQEEQLPLLIAAGLQQAGDYAGAAEQLKAVLARNPDDLEVRKSLAQLYVQMQMPDSANALYTDLMNQPGLNSIDYYQIGVGLYQAEDVSRAADAFEAAFEAAPHARDAAEMAARSLQIANPPGGEEEATPREELERLKAAADLWTELDPYSRNARLILAQTENRLGNADRARELISEIEEMPVVVENLQVRRSGQGGGVLTGSIMNVSAEAGSSVTLEFTLYGPGDTPMATETTTVELPAQEASQVFQLQVETEEPITGYTYQIQM